MGNRPLLRYDARIHRIGAAIIDQESTSVGVASLYMALKAKQRKHLKALAHHRRPAVLVGNAGITAPVAREIEQALERHELLKIRLPGVERGKRAEMLQRICDTTGAEAVQEIGRVAVIYRRAKKPRLVLPAE
jgi:RNA-binding protein